MGWAGPGEGSESRRDVQGRAVGFLEEVVPYWEQMAMDGEDVVTYVFVHAVVIEQLLCHVLGCAPGTRFCPANTSVTVIERPIAEGGVWRVSSVNDTQHLERPDMSA